MRKKYQILNSYKVYSHISWIHEIFNKVVRLYQRSDYFQEEGYFYQTSLLSNTFFFQKFADVIYLQIRFNKTNSFSGNTKKTDGYGKWTNQTQGDNTEL